MSLSQSDDTQASWEVVARNLARHDLDEEQLDAFCLTVEAALGPVPPERVTRHRLGRKQAEWLLNELRPFVRSGSLRQRAGAFGALLSLYAMTGDLQGAGAAVFWAGVLLARESPVGEGGAAYLGLSDEEAFGRFAREQVAEGAGEALIHLLDVVPNGLREQALGLFLGQNRELPDLFLDRGIVPAEPVELLESHRLLIQSLGENLGLAWEFAVRFAERLDGFSPEAEPIVPEPGSAQGKLLKALIEAGSDFVIWQSLAPGIAEGTFMSRRVQLRDKRWDIQNAQEHGTARDKGYRLNPEKLERYKSILSLRGWPV